MDRERSLDEIFVGIPGSGSNASIGVRTPFKFLDPYETEDREIFFGRDDEIKELYRKYYSTPLLLIYGESGTGKTSLLRCGLLAQIPTSDVLLIHIKNSASPIESLESEILNLLVAPAGHESQGGATPPDPSEAPPRKGNQGENVLDSLRLLYRAKRKPISILFDQFEELFIFQPDESRTDLISQVRSWLDSDLDIRVMFVIREEYLARLTEFESILPQLFHNRVWLRRMDPAKAEEAIEGPCRVCGVKVEKGLSSRLLSGLQADLKGVELPDLQVLMDQLYKKAVDRDRGNPEITLKDYERLGGIENILARFLEDMLIELPDSDLGREVLKLMVTPDGTKKSLRATDIAQALGSQKQEPSQEAIVALFQSLEKARILRAKPGDESYELRHDALARTIHSWLTETEKELAEVRQLVESRYGEHKKRGTLLDKETLSVISPFKSRLGLSSEHTAFIQKSQSAQQRKAKRRIFAIAAALSATILVLTGFTLWNVREKRIATARYLYSRALLDIDKPEAAAYLAASLRTHPTNEGRELCNKVIWNKDGLALTDRLLEENLGEDTTDVLASPDGRLVTYVLKPFKLKYIDIDENTVWELPETNAGADLLRFSPDGRLLVTKLKRGPYKVWDLDTLKNWTFQPHCSSRITLRGNLETAFSGDGRLLAVGFTDGFVTLWDSVTHEVKSFRVCKSLITNLRVNGDGRRVAVPRGDIFILDTQTGGVETLSSPGSGAACTTFLADGVSLVTGHEDGTVRLWSLDTGASQVLFSMEKSVSVVSVEQSGKWIAAGDSGGAVAAWNISERWEVRIPYVHSEAVWSIDFSQDGNWLATAGQEIGLASLHPDFASGSLLPGPGTPEALAFSKDSRVLHGYYAGGVGFHWRLNEAERAEFLPHRCAPQPVAYLSPLHLFASAAGGSVSITDWKTGQRWKLDVSASDANDLAFSPDGGLLAIAAEKRVVLYDVRSRKIIALFPEGIVEGPVRSFTSAVFSSDGKWLAASSCQNRGAYYLVDGKPTPARNTEVLVWSKESGETRLFCGHTGKVNRILFSADGKRLFSASADKDIREWDLISGSSKVFGSHQDEVLWLELSPDGKTLVSTSADRTVRFWDLAVGGSLSHQIPEAPRYLAFTTDGRKLVSFHDNGRLCLWDIAEWKVIRTLETNDLPEVWAFDERGEILAARGPDGSVILWDLVSGVSRQVLPPLQSLDLRHLAFSTDGRTLLALNGAYRSSDVTGRVTRSVIVPGIGPRWLLTPDLRDRDLVSTLDALTNLRYDPETDTVVPLPFKGIPKEWLEEGTR